MEITPLRTIVPFWDKYRFRARISRIWRPRFYNREDYDGLHYVLIDENGDSIHALISEDQHDDISQEWEPGQIYDIYHFATRKDSGSYRVLENELVVYFNGAKQFVKLDEIPIPRHSFRLVEIEQLEDQKSNEILTDIYGCIKTERAPHQQVLRNKEKVETKCEVTVQNLRREILKITLWGDIARSFDIDTPALAVFTSLIIGEFESKYSPKI